MKLRQLGFFVSALSLMSTSLVHGNAEPKFVGTMPKNYPFALKGSDEFMNATLGIEKALDYNSPATISNEEMDELLNRLQIWVHSEILAYLSVPTEESQREEFIAKQRDLVDASKNATLRPHQLSSLLALELKEKDVKEALKFWRAANTLLGDAANSGDLEEKKNAYYIVKRIVYTMAAAEPARINKIFPGTMPSPNELLAAGGIPFPGFPEPFDGGNKVVDAPGMGVQIVNAGMAPDEQTLNDILNEYKQGLPKKAIRALLDKVAHAPPEQKAAVEAKVPALEKLVTENVNKIVAGMGPGIEEQKRVTESFKIAVPAGGRTEYKDINPGHPAWLTVGEREARGSSAQAHWQSLEAEITKLMVKDDAEDKDRFDLHLAKRVMFYEKTKDSSTSAKIDVKDRYNLSWKMKWGDEMQTEVIANRLYMAAGGTFHDLVYNFGAGFTEEEGVILLIDSESEEPEKACGNLVVRNSDSLQDCLTKSPYKINLRPYVLKTGSLAGLSEDDKKILEIVQKLSGKKSEKLKKYNYVIFRESMLEFQGGGDLVRGGPIALNNADAQMDTVVRGGVLFNMWIANHDVKDDNAKGYLLDTGKKTYRYVESQHDLGMSMGSMVTAGEFESIKDTFIKLEDGGQTLRFDETFLYLPTAWTKTTYQDLVWMARNILSITPEDMVWAIDQTNWPDFMKIAAARKLLLRQYDIALNFTRSLPEASLAAQAIYKKIVEHSQDYTLTATMVATDVELTGTLGDTAQSTIVNPSFLKALTPGLTKMLAEKGTLSEKVLARGRIVSCRPVPTAAKDAAPGQPATPALAATPLQDAFVKYLNPSGYHTRISRIIDDYKAKQFNETATLPAGEEDLIGCFIREPSLVEKIVNR